MYETILVPTDGSVHAARAARQAEYVAGLFDADVHLLSVVDVDAEAGPFSAGGVGEDFVEELREGARESIRETNSHLGVDAETAVRTGRPSQAILEYVDEAGVDVIAMGTHGRTGVRRTVMGSVAERVLSHADVPVLTTRVPEEGAVDEETEYEEILVPTDATETVDPAVEHALAVAERTDARIHVVHVVHVGTTVGAGLSTPAAVLSALESAGEDATEQVADRAREAGLSAVTEVREGTPAKSIVSYAEEADVDLLAMATAGRTGLSRFLLGSTTEQVIRHADRPVLAVNARE
jgi:nucleotide-binding universal stress UspA family protein